MGNSASKASRMAATAGTRSNFPSSSAVSTTTTNTSPSASPTSQPTSSSLRPNPSSTTARSEAIDVDARDPHFDASLRHLGPAQPSHSPQTSFPTSSQPMQYGANIFPDRTSSSLNPAVALTQARQRWTRRFDEEHEMRGRASFAGRTLLSAKELREALALVESGAGVAEVERRERLKPGLLAKLAAGAVGNTS